MYKSFVLVTGANGFIGQALCLCLHGSGFKVRAAVRKIDRKLPNVYESVEVGDINSQTDWAEALNNIDVVVHLASRAHIIRDNASDPLFEFRKVNVFGTERLARMAAQHGVSRLIYISSVKVNSECTKRDPDGKMLCVSEEDIPNPQDYYAISKWEAERLLYRIKEETGLEIVILRSPLVYGPGVKANFQRLIKLIDLGIPLPFANLKNARSFIYLDNLVDVILKCTIDPKAAGQTFLVSDGQDISTPELMRMIAKAMKRKLILLPFPVGFLRVFGKVSGRLSEVERLINSLCVNNDKIVRTLDWKPPYTLEQGIKLTVDSYKSR